MGDMIHQFGIHSEKIMIVMEGQVQIRSHDYWIGNLNKGSCFNVYGPFDVEKPSKINYYSNSENCQIMYLPIDDLVNLCVSDPGLIELIDKIKITRFKVKYDIVDDLDYFPFPEKFLIDKVNLDDSIDEDIAMLKQKEKN